MTSIDLLKQSYVVDACAWSGNLFVLYSLTDERTTLETSARTSSTFSMCFSRCFVFAYLFILARDIQFVKKNSNSSRHTSFRSGTKFERRRTVAPCVCLCVDEVRLPIRHQSQVNSPLVTSCRHFFRPSSSCSIIQNNRPNDEEISPFSHQKKRK